MKKMLRRIAGLATAALLFCTGSAWAEEVLYTLNTADKVKIDSTDTNLSSDPTLTSSNVLLNWGNGSSVAQGCYLLWSEKLTSTGSYAMSALIKYDSSQIAGVGVLETDGSQLTGYAISTATSRSVRYVKEGAAESGAGYNYSDDKSVNDLKTETWYLVKMAVIAGKWYTEVYDEAGTTLYAYKNNPSGFGFETPVFLGIGGIYTSALYAKDIKVSKNPTVSGNVISMGDEVSISQIKYNQLPSLSILDGASAVSTLNIEPEENKELTVSATYQGSSVTVTAVSDDDAIATASVSGTTLTIKGVANGSATITVTNSANSSMVLTKTIAVTVASYPASNPAYGLTDAKFAYPKTGAMDAYDNGTLRLTFDDTPTLSESGYISLRKADGTEVDKINFADEVQEAWGGSNINVGSQLVRVEGKNVYIQSHFNKLAGSTKYYIAMPKGAITGKINGLDFNGFASGLDDTNGWSFTTKASAATPTSGAEITVSSNESDTPDYRSLNAALYALKNAAATDKYTIKLAAGDYYELVYYKGKANVKIIGQGTAKYGSDTVIRYINENARNNSTHSRAVFYWGGGSNLVLENLTIKNLTKRGETTTAKDVQAETIYFANGNNSSTYLAKATLAAFNCTFFSYQDTIHTSGKNWFYKCKISGDVDFIWGEAETCLVESCELTSLYDSAASAHAPAIIAARVGESSTSTVLGKGYVLKDCTITIEDGNTSSFGRQTSSSGVKNYDQAAVIDCIIK